MEGKVFGERGMNFHAATSLVKFLHGSGGLKLK